MLTNMYLSKQRHSWEAGHEAARAEVVKMIDEMTSYWKMDNAAFEAYAGPNPNNDSKGYMEYQKGCITALSTLKERLLKVNKEI